MIGNPVTKTGDLVVDPTTDKRYIVAGSQSLAELRRVPIVQNVQVSECATTDAAFKVKLQ
jgi:hypothetical protein